MVTSNVFLLRNANFNNSSNNNSANSSYITHSSNYRLSGHRYGQTFHIWSYDKSNSNLLITNNLTPKYVAFPWFLPLCMYKYIVTSNIFLLRTGNFNDSSNNNYANSSYSTLNSNYKLFCHWYGNTFHIWPYDKSNSALLITNNLSLKYVAFHWFLRLCMYKYIVTSSARGITVL